MLCSTVGSAKPVNKTVLGFNQSLFWTNWIQLEIEIYFIKATQFSRVRVASLSKN